MPQFKIAHVKENGVNLISVPLARRFGDLTEGEKNCILTELQDRAVALQLNGRVVPVWDDGGNMRFIAPREWHGFFRSLRLATVRANLNRELDLDEIATSANDADDTGRRELATLIAQVDPHEAWLPAATDKPSVLTRLARLVGLAR